MTSSGVNEGVPSPGSPGVRASSPVPVLQGGCTSVRGRASSPTLSTGDLASLVQQLRADIRASVARSAKALDDLSNRFDTVEDRYESLAGALKHVENLLIDNTELGHEDPEEGEQDMEVDEVASGNMPNVSMQMSEPSLVPHPMREVSIQFVPSDNGGVRVVTSCPPVTTRPPDVVMSEGEPSNPITDAAVKKVGDNQLLAAISTLGKSIVDALHPSSEHTPANLKHIRMPALSEPPDDAVLEKYCEDVERYIAAHHPTPENFLIAMLTAMKNEPYVFCKGIVDKYQKRYNSPATWGVIKAALEEQYQSKDPRELHVKKLLNLVWTEGRLSEHIVKFNHLVSMLEKYEPMAEPDYIRLFIKSLRNHTEIQKRLELTPMLEPWKDLDSLIHTAQLLGSKEIDRKGAPDPKRQKTDHGNRDNARGGGHPGGRGFGGRSGFDPGGNPNYDNGGFRGGRGGRGFRGGRGRGRHLFARGLFRPGYQMVPQYLGDFGASKGVPYNGGRDGPLTMMKAMGIEHLLGPRYGNDPGPKKKKKVVLSDAAKAVYNKPGNKWCYNCGKAGHPTAACQSDAALNPAVKSMPGCKIVDNYVEGDLMGDNTIADVPSMAAMEVSKEDTCEMAVQTEIVGVTPSPEDEDVPKAKRARKHPRMKVTTKQEEKEKSLRLDQDRKVRPQVLAEIQKLIPSPFTFEACTNVSGTNCVLPGVARAHPEDSFFTKDLVGHCVWMNPPFVEPERFVEYYNVQKQKSPHNTSCVLIVPIHRPKVNRFLQGWTLLKSYPPFTKLFERPVDEGCTQYETMPPFRDAVEVWYDPPAKNPCVYAVSDFLLDSKPTFVVKGTVGLGGADIAVSESKILFDTGATNCFVDSFWLKTHKPEYAKKMYKCPECVQLANGSKQKVEGLIRLGVKMGNYSGSVLCYVVDLHSYNLVLGDNWLREKRSYIDYRTESIVIHQGKKRYTINPKRVLDPQGREERKTMSNTIAPMLTAMQTKRALGKGCELCVILVTKEDPELNAVKLTPGEVLEAIEQMDRERLIEICRKVIGIFRDPPGYDATDRDINVPHTIPLPHGHTPPYGPRYRHTPIEKEELTKQVTEGIAKGIIEPSTAPYGAPVIFVKKKDGSLRMCVDYRALNRITIKNRYPLPRIDDLLDEVGKAKYFTSLDLASGYHQIRINPEDVPKTSFITPFGHFQWKVLIEGLTNAPATFQHFMNEIFKKERFNFVAVYLDDILIYSKTEEEHYKHIEQVLDVLKKNNLFLRFEKCSFFKREVKYLGHIIDEHGVRPDPDKVRAVKEWPPPKNTHELKSFLGLTNYFRKFIRGYSQYTFPLTQLLKKNTPWIWAKPCEVAFEFLKQSLMSAPVLVHYDPEGNLEVIVDASKVALGAILMCNDRPVAYESRKLTPAESRYDTGDRELLAVIHALKVWRPYLDGVPFKLVTDHEPNTYLKSITNWSDRQARWNQKIERFSYTWVYRKGLENIADPLSRMPSLNVITRSMLKANALPEEPEEDSFGPTPSLPPGLPVDKNKKPVYTRPKTKLKASHLVQAYKHDAWLEEAQDSPYKKGKNGYWYYGDRIVIPSHQECKELRTDLIAEHHDTPLAGHRGFRKTKESLARTFHWKGMAKDVKEYIEGCYECSVNKSSTQAPTGLLQPLPTPKKPWEWMSMDFITGLPCTEGGQDALLVFVDMLTKLVHLRPCTKKGLTSEVVADMFEDEIIRHHGVPAHIVSDRDPVLTSVFWKEVIKRLNSHCNFSTSFHPQTDGQTERFNRSIEEIIRCFLSPDMLNWPSLLPFAEFSINDHVHAGTEYSPFYLTYGHHPTRPVDIVFDTTEHKDAKDRIDLMHKALLRARQLLDDYKSRMKQRADKQRKDKTFLPGDKVWLSSKNFSFKYGTRKLLPRWLGPYVVEEPIGKVSYRLKLPEGWKVHPVFHASLLKAVSEHTRYCVPEPAGIDEDGQPTWEITAVLKHRELTQGHREYLVAWKGFGPEYYSWQPEDQLSAKATLQKYWSKVEANPTVGSTE